MRRFTVPAAVLGAGVLIAAGVAVAPATATPTSHPAARHGEGGLVAENPAAIPDPNAPSPASSGLPVPSTSQLPTGPAVPGPRPGTVTVNAGGHPLTCSIPGNPYGSASIHSVYARPGIAVREYQKSGRTRMFATVANLAGPGARIRTGPLTRGSVTDTATLKEKITGSHAYAATNADFFHLTTSGAANGVEINRGAIIRKGLSWKQPSLILQRNGTATTGLVWLTIDLRAPKRSVYATGFNSEFFNADGITVFNPLWGSASRTYLHPSQTMREFVVAGNRVVAVHSSITSTPVPSNGFVIEAQGHGAGNLILAGLKTGAPVSLGVGAHSDAPAGIDSAIGVGMTLVHQGVRQGPICSVDRPVARTIVGIMPGGTRMFVAVVEGQTDSATDHFTGLTARDSTELAKDMGASEAVMFDGGGSAGVAVNGMYDRVVQFTVPAYGWDRNIANGYGFWVR